MKPITTQDELDIISLYARGWSMNQIVVGLKHGKTQVWRTLQPKNLCKYIYRLLQNKDLLESANQELQNRKTYYVFYILTSMVIGYLIGILI